MNDLELKRKRIETFVKIGALAIIGFLVAPFIFVAIKGLLGLALALAIGLFGVNVFAPWFGAKIANWRLKAIKHEASLNPIETLENKYAEKESALVQIRENLKKFVAAVQTLHSAIQEHNQKYPNSPSQFQEKYLKMRDLLNLRGAKYKDAQRNLARFAEIIEEKRSDWKVAQSAAAANELAQVGEDFTSKLQIDTALGAVQDSLNLAFSELEVSLLDEQTQAPVSAQITSVPTQRKLIEATPPTLDLDFIEAETVSIPVSSKKTYRR